MVEGDFYASPFGVVYSTYMERPWLARAISRVVWGGDLRPYYEAMGAGGEVRAGGVVVDCPCGAGPALRAVPRDRGLRYVAADLSPSMLRRAGKRADRREVEGVELVEASATSLPLPSGSADLFFSFWGLHCFDDPGAALAEAARVLAPGGRLVGSTFVRGDDSLRQRLLIRPGAGDFGAVPDAAEVERMLEKAGLVAQIQRCGPMLYFDGRPA
jgi:SAM-dependent methyltransferase